jgi:hypothetical protein
LAEVTTIAELGTAGGTLVLALATFASVRSANRAARVAERSLLVGLRPTLMPSRPQDPDEQVGFVDGRVLHVPAGSAAVVHEEGRVLMAIALRNVGAGLAVLEGWHVRRGFTRAGEPHGDPADFRRLSRDLYIAPGDTGYWQGAVRDSSDPLHHEVRRALDSEETLTVEILYSDQEGGQRFVTRFGLRRHEGEWRAAAGRHWALDAGRRRRASPRAG